MKEKLNPCPFCGGNKVKLEPLGEFGLVNLDPVFAIWTVSCHCGGQAMKDGKADTIKAWNRRA